MVGQSTQSEVVFDEDSAGRGPGPKAAGVLAMFLAPLGTRAFAPASRIGYSDGTAGRLPG
jgi:hypothetical protein